MMRLRTICQAALLAGLVLLAAAAPRAVSAQDFTSIDSLREAGAYQEALSALQEQQSDHPDESDVLWRLGQTYVDLGEQASGDRQEELYERAIEAAEAAVEAGPQNSQAHLTLATAAGRVALNSGTQRKVELSRTVKEHADRAIELDPQNEMAYHIRGRWHYGVSDLSWMERTVVRAVYGGLPEASFEAAARDLEEAASLGTRVVHHLELGRTYLQLDRPEQARRHLEQALSLPVRDPLDEDYQAEARRLIGEVE